MRKCKTHFCRKKAQKNRLNCSACIKRKWRKANPIKASYQNLKDNAKRRGKGFGLTFEQFKEFGIESGYLAGKGIYKDSFHIDRINPEEGYFIWNIRKLPNHENVSRHHKYLKMIDDGTGKPAGFVVISNPISETPAEDCEDLLF